MSRYANTALLTAVLLLAACGGAPGPAPVDDSRVQRQPAQAQPEPGPGGDSEQTAAPAADTAQPGPGPFSEQAYQQAVSALKRGDTDAAISLLLAVSTEAPEQPFVFTNLGLAYFTLQQYNLALAAFQQAVGRNPNDAVAYNHLGVLQRQQGEFEAARQSYQRALEIDPNYALAHLNLGILFDIYLQDLEPALRHYQRYQALLGEENETVSGWIVDLERRLQSAAS